MSELRTSKYRIDEFPPKERLILIQKIELLQNENEELRGREISLKKINAVLIDALNSNPNIQEKVLTQLRILNAGKNVETVIRRYEQEIQRLKEQFAKKDACVSRTYAATLKPQNQQNCTQRRVEKESRLNSREPSTKQSSQIGRFTAIPSPSSAANSCSFLKHRHRRRFSQKIDEIVLREREQELSRINQISQLMKEKGVIERMLQNCQRKSNQNVQTQIQQVVYIVKNKKVKEQSCRKQKQRILQSLLQGSAGKFERVEKPQTFRTPGHAKRCY